MDRKDVRKGMLSVLMLRLMETYARINAAKATTMRTDFMWKFRADLRLDARQFRVEGSTAPASRRNGARSGGADLSE